MSNLGKIVNCLTIILIHICSWVSSQTAGNTQHMSGISGIHIPKLEKDTWNIDSFVSGFVDNYFQGCHLLVVRESNDVYITDILRMLELWDSPVSVAGPWQTTSADTNTSLVDDRSSEGFFIGDPSYGCRVLICYLDDTVDDMADESLMRFLESSNFWKFPSMSVLGIGKADRRRDFLLHHSLRNAYRALYLVPHSEGFDIHLHCLYCNDGGSDVILLNKWRQDDKSWTNRDILFPDQFRDFNGHLMRIVTMPFFPFIDFTPDSEERMSTVTLKRSLDLFLLEEVSTRLNFTYILRLPVDKEWAQPLGNGSWTGLVGTLQREDADFSTCLFYDYGRMQACDFTRLFAPDPMVIVSRKAQPLPPYLAIIKPFSEMMWIGIVVTFLIVGIIFWIMQRGWRQMIQNTPAKANEDEALQRHLNFLNTIFFTWGLFLQQQPFQYPTQLYGRLWITWWLIFSLLVLSLYKSALIASLSVPQMSEPVDSFEQLLERNGWSWGMEPHYSVGWLWLKESLNPGIQKIFGELEFLQVPEHMQRIGERGDHAFISWTNYVRNIIISEYTERSGYTPMHMSRQRYMGTGCSWATRRGMPYYRTLDKMQQYLVQGNFMQLWLNEIFMDTFKKARERNTTTISNQQEEGGGQIVFSLYHLQGAFYVLFMGIVLSTLLFLSELVFG